IGNSLTTANDLPGLIEAMSSSVGAPLRCEKVTFDGFSLEDHWNEGSARRAIAKGGWSTVVLQQISAPVLGIAATRRDATGCRISASKIPSSRDVALRRVCVVLQPSCAAGF